MMEYLKKARDFLAQHYKRIAAVLTITCVIFVILAVIPAAKFDYEGWEKIQSQIEDVHGEIATEQAVANVFGDDREADQLQEQLEEVLALRFQHARIKEEMQDKVRNRGIIAGVCAIGAIALCIYGKKATGIDEQADSTTDEIY